MAYILIVEDNEMNRDMLGRNLKEGFEIEFALDEEGLDKMREEKDLVQWIWVFSS